MKISLTLQIMIAILLGIVAGVVFGERIEHIAIIGDIFIKLLKMIIIPLIVASMVVGIVSLGDVRKLGNLGLKTFAYYVVTTSLAVILGLVLVNLIKPGAGVEKPSQVIEQVTPPTLHQIVLDMVPENIFYAMAQSKVLQVILFSLLLGAALTTVRDRAAGLISFFDGLNAVVMKLTGWIMRLAPIGIFALMADVVGTTGLDSLKKLAAYMITVLIGLAIHGILTLPLLLWLIARYPPWRFARHLFPALSTAFSTASSAVTLPITMECLQDNVGVSRQTTSFVLPLGATVNMDGTALYEAVAALFIAQVYGVDLTFAQQFTIFLTATLASVGTAAIPGAGLFTMVIVLNAVNLPTEGIVMILAVDRILDMCRTTVNVWGDACGAALVARLQGESFKPNQPRPPATANRSEAG